MTEGELRAFMVEAEREFTSMLVKFGTETKTDRVRHLALAAGFRDGLNTMARFVRDRGALTGKSEPLYLRDVADLVAETRTACEVSR